MVCVVGASGGRSLAGASLAGAWIVAAALAVATLGCGGGGGSSAPVIDEGPPPVFPVDPPGEQPSTARIILQSGDRIDGGIGVANIEDAALAADGTIAAIVSVANRGGARAVVRRTPGGRFQSLFGEGDAPPDVDLRTLLRLRMAPTGELIFQAGDGLDTDRLFEVIGDDVIALAGAAPGVTPPDFRVLGNVRIGVDGVVAFVGGGHACEVSLTPGGSRRHVCRLALFVAEGGSPMRLETDAVDLDETATTTVRVELDPSGAAYFSVPGRRDEATLLRVAGADVATVLTAEQEVPGLGSLLGDVEAVDVGPAGQILVTGALPPPEQGAPRPRIVGILHGDEFTTIAVQGRSIDGRTVQGLRAIAIDAAGNALYEAQLADPARPDDPPRRSLRLADGSRDVEIAREGAPAPDGGATIITIDAARQNEAGDVVFLTSLGRVADDITYIEETRASLRRADGAVTTLVSSARSVQFGTLSRLLIVGLDEQGRVLILGERGQSSNRVLLLTEAADQAA